MAQKIFYLHVPAAWSALLAFSLVGIASALYLWLHDPRLDRFAAASAEVGVAFSAVMLTTGPIWAKPIWGTWWTWDARLTLTLFLFFLFVGYLALRAAVHDPAERARFSAVVGILGHAAGALHSSERLSVPHAASRSRWCSSRARRRCRPRCCGRC